MISFFNKPVRILALVTLIGVGSGQLGAFYGEEKAIQLSSNHQVRLLELLKEFEELQTERSGLKLIPEIFDEFNEENETAGFSATIFKGIKATGKSLWDNKKKAVATAIIVATGIYMYKNSLTPADVYKSISAIVTDSLNGCKMDWCKIKTDQLNSLFATITKFAANIFGKKTV
jgi:hypothetical protein